MHIIVCYDPTNYSPVEREEEYYEELQSVVDEIPERDMKIVIDDFNAKVGRNNRGIKNVIGVECLNEFANKNGALLISFCSANNLVIGGILFQKKNIHKYTWTSPCGIYKRQIEHITINKERSGNLINVRSYRGADISSDHQLLIATLKLKLKVHNRKVERIYRGDTTKLLEEEHRETFASECRKEFAVLETLREEEQAINEQISVS
ncbi:craniofacial development protein 2-like [Palaemon carinicauda]|uniref:craniofacial development protein 2-like n=1 Tax=Palaemon carinicauda TaxID=392227 RepID=UPI0035B5C24C